MKIVALKDHLDDRVPIVPDTVKSYIKLGFEVLLERNIGDSIFIRDEEYLKAGAKILSDKIQLLNAADILIKVQRGEHLTLEAKHLKESSIVIGLLDPYDNKEYFENLKEKNIKILCMEKVPRTTRAQSMDALSSQASLLGYRAVLEATSLSLKVMPMMTTAAGTISAAKVLIIGAGVAGLQAIATAKRLGAIVFATDVRSAAKEQVESLGGKFLELLSMQSNEQAKGGYANELNDSDKNNQQQALEKEISKFDIIITTAMIPGKKAPLIITENMVKNLNPGAVIIDLAAKTGGNCALTKLDEVALSNGVTIVGLSNIVGKVAKDASKLYSKNIFNLIEYAYNQNTKELNVLTEDEIIGPMII
jgi:NAD(P) transhydrogenase subunit alpha